ncbi:unnamed protein product, partial [Ectocarpus sp. 13 AM-2016]
RLFTRHKGFLQLLTPGHTRPHRQLLEPLLLRLRRLQPGSVERGSFGAIGGLVRRVGGVIGSNGGLLGFLGAGVLRGGLCRFRTLVRLVNRFFRREVHRSLRSPRRLGRTLTLTLPRRTLLATR